MTYELITVLNKASELNNVNRLNTVSGSGSGSVSVSGSVSLKLQRALIALGPIFQLSSMTIW